MIFRHSLEHNYIRDLKVITPPYTLDFLLTSKTGFTRFFLTIFFTLRNRVSVIKIMGDITNFPEKNSVSEPF
ncbi:MAG: hypothetical protein RLZZ338_2164 [Cyanobacteriota bacterium]|jgi:hypothetical protein